MKFFKNILFVVAFFSFLQGQAQQKVGLNSFETDSLKIQVQRESEFRQLVSGLSPEFLLIEVPQFPKFDFKSNFISDYSFNFSRFFSSGLPFNGFSMASPTTFFAPFYGNATVLSQGVYQLNSKFSMGGYSYGINSPFSAPLPNAFDRFDRYGSTFFMQYKVGKNFKIETRINVQQGGPMPGF